MASNVDDWINDLWLQYVGINSQALSVHRLLTERGENVINDHIALRTFGHNRVNIDVLGGLLEAMGYVPVQAYRFSIKHLSARHYEHENTSCPKIFISELELDKFSARLQRFVDTLVDQIPSSGIKECQFLCSGIAWNAISYSDYMNLKEESEYAAWLAAFGFRANHFTVAVHCLESFRSLLVFNNFLKQNGFCLNTQGGEIKGSSEVYLEQSSTMAESVPVAFSDKVQYVPACYYEFAYRHVMPNGKLYQGFVEQSADKIFESTDNHHSG